MCGASARPAAGVSPSLCSRPGHRGTIKGNPAAGIVPVKDLIEANRKDEYIPMAEPIPGETGSSAPLAESIPNAEPIPGETNLHAPVQPAEASLAIPSTAFSPFRFLSMKPA
ncbi:hypothetical protein M5E88_15155 [Akkermansia muciniphila]|nr:hypothetical protein M5E88_15155 [Akkermansia muciniphila]